MTKLRSTILAASAALMLSGCAGGIDLVNAGQPADLGDGVSVVPPNAWARVHVLGGQPFWTIDGIGLDELRYYTGIAPGQPIMSVAGASDKEVGTYSAGMLPNDVVDLVVSTLGKGGAQNVRASNLAPAPFGSVTGFRFDLAFSTADGLEMQGEALAAQRNGKLDVVFFIAPAEYYFPHWKPSVDQVLASVHTAG